MKIRIGGGAFALGGAAIGALFAFGGTAATLFLPAAHAAEIKAPAAVPAAQAANPASPPAAANPNDPKAIVDIGAVIARSKSADYQRAKWDPIHFKPAIDQASNEACLVCHKEVMSEKPREASPAGWRADQVEAWYQTLDTYAGAQEKFHWRHLQSPYAKQVMDLKCNFCHQGNDPREMSPHVLAPEAQKSDWRGGAQNFSLRKRVNVSETCLRCHGVFPGENMGLPVKWEETKESLESADTPNGCLTCHAEQFRTVRHQVNYLNAKGIEEAAKTTSDVCYGCHGGRHWYRISYPYPRHPWPDMPTDTPDWAKDRPTASDARFALPVPAK
jgi:nitrate/TMAO reductase-like tetraheme cytochrome c subunit